MPPPQKPPSPVSRRTRRLLYFLAGSLALTLALIGVAVPVLPTTPFLLVAAFCFARSSNRVHDWLLTNRVFGRHLRGYLAGRGVSIWVKVGMLVLLWGTIGVSAGLFVPHL